jgi:hypothetical protein
MVLTTPNLPDEETRTPSPSTKFHSKGQGNLAVRRTEWQDCWKRKKREVGMTEVDETECRSNSWMIRPSSKMLPLNQWVPLSYAMAGVP